jgi:hypothetical protein
MKPLHLARGMNWAGGMAVLRVGPAHEGYGFHHQVERRCWRRRERRRRADGLGGDVSPFG